jgi:hypothetical protein
MIKKKMTRLCIALATVATACSTGPAMAEGATEGLLADRFVISLGTFLLDTDTEIALNGSAGQVGTVIDVQKDLGLDDADRVRLDANWRFLERHHLRVLYFDTKNEASKTLDRQITIGDTTYPLNGRIDAEQKTAIWELAYEYAFLRRPTYEVLASAGLHIADFELNVTGNGTVSGRPVSAKTESGSATAPLPVFGLRGTWEFSPKWYAEGQFQYFTLSYDDYDGDITDFRVSVTRMFGEHWGIGAGWNQFTTKVDLTKPKFNGSLDWTYGGFQVFVTAAF